MCPQSIPTCVRSPGTTILKATYSVSVTKWARRARGGGAYQNRGDVPPVIHGLSGPLSWEPTLFVLAIHNESMSPTQGATQSMDHRGGVSSVLVRPPPLALQAHLVAKGQQLLAIHMVGPKAPDFFFHSPCPFCPLRTPTLSLNPTLTLMPTPTLSLLLTLPTNLTLDPNPYPSPNPNQD